MSQELKVRNKKKIFIKIVAIFILLGGLIFWFFHFNKKEEKKTSKVEENISTLNNNFSNSNKEIENSKEMEKVIREEKIAETKKEEATVNVEEIKLPDKVHYEVDFASQAPFGIWNELHEEACEEASLIIVKFYLTGEILTKEKMEGEIQKLVKYQKENYGDYKDSDIEQLKEMAEGHYDLEDIKILRYFDINNLKKELAEGHLIIIPVAGRELGNPNFTPPGPLYHNLVLIGYDDRRKVFITNDPGTRNGQNYEYDYQILYDAIHDFHGDKNKISEGEKKALVF